MGEKRKKENKHLKMESGDTTMVDVSTTFVSTAKPSQNSASKSYEIFSCTVKKPAYAYAHLRMQSDDPGKQPSLDALQARSYCAIAMQQFLGATGAAVTIDVLKVDEAKGEFWVRLSGPDLGRFSAAVTSWPGAVQSGVTTGMRILAAGDWLGSLLGRSEQQSLWIS